MFVDKNSIKAVNEKNEFIYLFDNEPLEELLKTNLHCIHYKDCNFVDINLTNYNVDCVKKANINDIDFDKFNNVTKQDVIEVCKLLKYCNYAVLDKE